MTAESALAVAIWIEYFYLPRKPSRQPALLDVETAIRERRRMLADLAKKLRKISRNKRAQGRVFKRPLPRAAVRALVQESGLHPPFRLPGSSPPVRPFIPSGPFQTQLEAMEKALATAGRPRLAPDERKARIVKKVSVERDYRTRLKHQQAIDDAWTDFIRQGGTLFGSDIPFPNPRKK